MGNLKEATPHFLQRLSSNGIVVQHAITDCAKTSSIGMSRGMRWWETAMSMVEKEKAEAKTVLEAAEVEAKRRLNA